MSYIIEKQPYLYFKQHNKELYDDSHPVLPNSAKEAILIYCIKHKGTYTDAYKCQQADCPLYNFKKKWMKRPHTASEWFLKNKNDISKQ